MSQSNGSKQQHSGGKASDVAPFQKVHELCSDCQRIQNPSCQVCAMMRMTQEPPPFTKEQVKQLHKEMMCWFLESPKGIIKLTVSKNSMLIGKIDWTMNNCAFSVLVLMLSTSDAALDSINQKIFAGYILAVIINAIQETGSCDPIVLEVFRLELTILSGNPVWSNWSDLVEFHELFGVCVKNNILLHNTEVEFVLPNEEDGSYNVGKRLNGKRGSTVVGAYKWYPPIYVLFNGILSDDISSKYRITAVVLHKDDHFSIIILIDGGFFWIDGKGKRMDEFKAQSTLHGLTIDQFQELCASHGAFYFFEEVPFVTEEPIFFGTQAIPPQPAPCAQDHWVPSPPQQAPSAQVDKALPPPQQGTSAKVSPYPKQISPLTQSDITVSGEKWSCNGRAFSGKVEKMPHPKFPQVMMEVYFYENVSKTTLKDLVDFLNFIESIQ